MPHTLQASGQRALFRPEMTVAFAPEEGVWARQKEGRQDRAGCPVPAASPEQASPKHAVTQTSPAEPSPRQGKGPR